MTDADGFWTTGYGGGELENGSMTLLLVEGFSGSVDDDLDTNDDGVFDVTPWTSIVDGVAVDDGGGSDLTYATPALAANFDGGIFSVGGASRVPDGTDTDGTGDWVRNDFDGDGLPCCAGAVADPGEAINTFGASNVVATALPDVVINEVDADQDSVDDAEFVELFDGGAGSTDLTGLSIVLYNGSDDLAYESHDLDGESTDGDGYFVLCSDAATVANCDLEAIGSIQNGEDGVALVVGDAVDFPNDAALPDEGDIVDAIVYETGSDTDSGLLVLLNGGQGVVDEDGGTDSTVDSNQRCPNGSGGQRNTDTYTQVAPTPGAENDCPDAVVPDVVINEVDADQDSVDDAEFVELFDGGAGSTDLTGLSIVLYNGSDDLAYESHDLDGESTDGDGYFVLCSDAATVANCDLEAIGSIQNGEDGVALVVGDAVDFPNDAALPDEGDIVDAIVYETGSDTDSGLLVLLNGGQGVVDEDGGTDSTVDSNQRCPNGSGGQRNTDTYFQGAPTAGEENRCVLFIHQVQGDGATTPFDGSLVIVEGVVVGDFQHTTLEGFFLQEEDDDVDGSDATSEGIFVFDDDFGVDVEMGDTVKVTGTAVEFFDLTEINAVTAVEIIEEDPQVATPVTLTFPVAVADDFENIEGMSVVVPQTMVISEFFNFDRFGEITLATERLQQPTAVFAPGSVAAADLADLNARSKFTLDDGETESNPEISRHPNGDPFSLANRFRGGDTVANVVGVIHDSFGYRIHATDGADYTAVNTRPANPPNVGGDVTVAAFNVLNYFTTLDVDTDICGPNADQGCRGANDAGEFTRQRVKIIDAIAEIDADVVGLMEIENHATDDAIIDLVAGLNAAMGAGTYDYVPAGPTGPDVIKVAFIYKPGTMSLDGAHAILDTNAFLDPNNLGDDKNRAAIAQTFTEIDSGESFTVVVNHFKSKGSSCGDGDDDDEAASCNLTRTLAAEVLVDWLAGDPTDSSDPDYLVIGDLNSYDKEEPIDAMKRGADDTDDTDDDYRDLLREFQGENEYTFVFSAQWGYLDYAMANESIRNNVTGAAVWHINSDEPDILDYDTTFKSAGQIAIYEDNEYRSSDHDPVIIGLTLPELPATGPSDIVRISGPAGAALIIAGLLALGFATLTGRRRREH